MIEFLKLPIEVCARIHHKSMLVVGRKYSYWQFPSWNGLFTIWRDKGKSKGILENDH